jgi:prepilin-type processing-associated H-X9-DG protein
VWPDFSDVPDTHHLITLWSVLSRMSSKSYTGEDMFASANDPNNDPSKNSAPFLRCPEAMQVLSHICSYAGNFIAFNSPSYDIVAGAGGADYCPVVTQSTKTTQLLPFTALIWDTNVQPGMQKDVGYITGADIDGQRFWDGAATPQWRYYSPNDPFASFQLGNNQNVRMVVGSIDWKNIDPPAATEDGFSVSGWPWQGNLRFRHNKNTTCNVGYSDGHVAQFVGKFKSDGTPLKYEAPRKNFMVKWPTGVGPDPSLPY